MSRDGRDSQLCFRGRKDDISYRRSEFKGSVHGGAPGPPVWLDSAASPRTHTGELLDPKTWDEKSQIYPAETRHSGLGISMPLGRRAGGDNKSHFLHVFLQVTILPWLNMAGGI